MDIMCNTSNSTDNWEGYLFQRYSISTTRIQVLI